MVSSVVATLTVAVVWPAAMVSVVDTAVKSFEPAVSPLTTEGAASIVTSCVLAADSCTVNATASPSSAEAAATLSVGSVDTGSAVTGRPDSAGVRT